MDGADASPGQLAVHILYPAFAFFHLSPYTIKLWNILHKTYESEQPCLSIRVQPVVNVAVFLYDEGPSEAPQIPRPLIIPS